MSFILTVNRLLHHGQDPLEKYEDKEDRIPEESKEIDELVVVGIEDVNK